MLYISTLDGWQLISPISKTKQQNKANQQIGDDECEYTGQQILSSNIKEN